MDPMNDPDPSVMDGYLVRLSGRAWGVSCGVLLGGGLFVATMVLVVKGGDNVGQHLGLLSQYLPFYSVSFSGAAVGLLWGALIGFALGHSICMVYNRVAR